MLATIFTGTARYRRQILATAVVVAASVLWLHPLVAPPGGPLALVAIASAVLAFKALSWRQPAALAVDPRRRAFHALSEAGSVYLVVTLIFASTIQIRSVRFVRSSSDTGQGPHRLGTILLTDMTVLLVGLSAVLLVLVWRGFGVELRPDGLIDRRPFGVLTVPWEALAPGYPQPGPAAGSLVLSYARPELIRRRHIVFSRRKLAAQFLNVDPRFLSAVIAHYVAYPQYRAAIGTQAEYERLRHALTNPAGPLPATSR